MKKILFYIIKSLKKPEKKPSIDSWLYGYYACSSLCMTPIIILSEDNK